VANRKTYQPGTPATPRDCPLMQSVLATARMMFPGDPWEEVEPHMQRAWVTIAEPVAWEDARPWLHDAWGADGSDGGGPDGNRDVDGGDAAEHTWIR